VEAAWALANLAGADGAAVLPAAPALIERLGGSGGLALAELCAWALGSFTSVRRCQCKQVRWGGPMFAGCAAEDQSACMQSVRGQSHLALDEASHNGQCVHIQQ